MSVMSAYEKMLKDGRASKPIKIAQPTPTNPDGNKFGAPISDNVSLGEYVDNDWSSFDSQMQEYIEKKKAKKGKKKSKKVNEKKSVSSSGLEERVAFLESIVEKLMKSQMEILKNG